MSFKSISLQVFGNNDTLSEFVDVFVSVWSCRYSVVSMFCRAGVLSVDVLTGSKF